MRINTRDTLNAFMARKAYKKCSAIWTDGAVIYSYSTVIATWLGDNRVELDLAKYSKTTTTHQNALHTYLIQWGVQVETTGA